MIGAEVLDHDFRFFVIVRQVVQPTLGDFDLIELAAEEDTPLP